MSSALSNPDAGARVIAPHIALSEIQGPAYVTAAVRIRASAWSRAASQLSATRIDPS
jgi:hypothetical protein